MSGRSARRWLFGLLFLLQTNLSPLALLQSRQSQVAMLTATFRGPSIFANGASVSGNLGVSGTLRLYDVVTKGPVIDVRAYGATGDGIANDTVAIQAALDAAATKNGGSVYVPSGTYTISASLEVASNTIFFGDGRTSKLAASSVTLPQNQLTDENSESSTMAAIVYVKHNATNVTIRDLFVDGAYSGTGAGSSTFGILLGKGSTDCVVRNNFVEDNSWSGILAKGTGHLIQGNFTKHNAIDGIESWGSKIRIIGNHSQGDGADTVTPGNGGIEVMAESATAPTVSDIQVIGNEITGSRMGIVTGSTGVSTEVIANNVIDAPSQRGININAAVTDLTITGNIVKGSLGSGALGNGITVTDATRFIVSKNTVQDSNAGSGPSGIQIEGSSSQGLVEENITSNNWVGLAVANTADNITITGNNSYCNLGANYSNTSSGTKIVTPSNAFSSTCKST